MTKTGRIGLRPRKKLFCLLHGPEHCNHRAELIDAKADIEVVRSPLGSLKRGIAHAIRQSSKEETNRKIRVGLGDVRYRWREVTGETDIVLNNQQMAAFRNVGQAFAVSQPRVRRVARVCADLSGKRGERLL